MSAAEPVEAAGRAAGGRVLLRYAEPRDEAGFLALRRASRAHLAPWEVEPEGGWNPFGPEAFARVLESRDSPRRRRWLLCRREDGEILGACSLTQITRGVVQSAIVDYWIGARHVRRGYMSEGLVLVLEQAFGELALHRVEALVLPENEASRRLLARVGFRFEGLSRRLVRMRGAWRDHERWAITSEERRP